MSVSKKTIRDTVASQPELKLLIGRITRSWISGKSIEELAQDNDMNEVEIEALLRIGALRL